MRFYDFNDSTKFMFLLIFKGFIISSIYIPIYIADHHILALFGIIFRITCNLEFIIRVKSPHQRI